MSTTNEGGALDASSSDARALQMRLYRELGIAAVIAALDTTVALEDVLRRLPLQQISAAPTSIDEAA